MMPYKYLINLSLQIMENDNFNVTVYNFGSELQIRFFKKGYKTGNKIDNKKKELITGEERYIKDMENRTRSIRRTKEKIYFLARCNTWEYFCTLTFNQAKVDRTNYKECYNKLRNFLKKVKVRNPEFKYLAVPELHKKEGYHFHTLIRGLNKNELTRAIGANTGIEMYVKTKQGNKPLYNWKNYKLGFSSLVEISKEGSPKLSNYLMKYITKDLMNQLPGRKKVLASQGLDGPVKEVMNLTEQQKRDLYNNLKLSGAVKYEKEIIVNNEVFYNRINILEVKND